MKILPIRLQLNEVNYGGFKVLNNKKKLTKDDLYIGLLVTIDQLSEIYGLRIFLDDYDNEKGGKIIYFTNKEVDSEENNDNTDEPPKESSGIKFGEVIDIIP